MRWDHELLGGNLGNFFISLMVPIEVPIHKYFSEPQNYNPGFTTMRIPTAGCRPVQGLGTFRVKGLGLVTIRLTLLQPTTVTMT